MLLVTGSPEKKTQVEHRGAAKPSLPSPLGSVWHILKSTWRRHVSGADKSDHHQDVQPGAPLPGPGQW